MKWGVKAHQDWHQNRLENINFYDHNVFEANLENLATLRKECLIESLCKFIPQNYKE